MDIKIDEKKTLTPNQEIPALFNGNALSGENNYKFELKRETQEEHTARVGRETKEANFKLYKDAAVTGVSTIFILVIGIACTVIILKETYTEKTQELATTILLLIVGGLVGFMTGKATYNKEK